MQWFVTNWFWVLIGVLFIAMHLFGHGGHGGHGGGSRPRRDDEGKTDDTQRGGANRSAGGHHH
ncbi:MAG: DUF2933 domain-containing protein [Gemmatimonadales bacterium]